MQKQGNEDTWEQAGPVFKVLLPTALPTTMEQRQYTSKQHTGHLNADERAAGLRATPRLSMLRPAPAGRGVEFRLRGRVRSGGE